jgi:hypothetical protein
MLCVMEKQIFTNLFDSISGSKDAIICGVISGIIVAIILLVGNLITTCRQKYKKILSDINSIGNFPYDEPIVDE